LDEHISRRVAQQIRLARPDIEIVSVQDWEGGTWMTAIDEVLLSAARGQRLTLVTYDQSTIPLLLKEWGEQRIPHAGVIFIDDRTIARYDFGGLIRSSCSLYDTLGALDWTDRIVHLKR
jgi:hypothetical protein